MATHGVVRLERMTHGEVDRSLQEAHARRSESARGAIARRREPSRWQSEIPRALQIEVEAERDPGGERPGRVHLVGCVHDVTFARERQRELGLRVQRSTGRWSSAGRGRAPPPTRAWRCRGRGRGRGHARAGARPRRGRSRRGPSARRAGRGSRARRAPIARARRSGRCPGGQRQRSRPRPEASEATCDEMAAVDETALLLRIVRRQAPGLTSARARGRAPLAPRSSARSRRRAPASGARGSGPETPEARWAIRGA